MSLDGVMPPELEDDVDMPAGFEYLWGWFTRLSACRPSAMDGVSGIPESEIRAYFQNRGIRPEPWELRVIERLDAVAIDAGNKSQKDGTDQPQD
jgi:hypothetical protein